MGKDEHQDIYRVLFVDDEPSILQSIKRGLISEPYVKFYALSGQEALDIMKDNEIHVIVSDMRMPIMSGLDLLMTVSELYPDTVRIVLSGYNHLAQVFATINTIKVFKYLPKPWDMDTELMPTVLEALEQYKMTISYKNINAVLERKNEFYQKLLKSNDDCISRIKSDNEVLKTYMIFCMNAMEEHLLKSVDNFDNPSFPSFFPMTKRAIHFALTLHSHEPGHVDANTLHEEFEQLKAIWIKLIHSKLPDAQVNVTLQLQDMKALKLNLPISSKQLMGTFKLILFNLYALNIQAEKSYNFTVDCTLSDVAESPRIALKLDRPIDESERWLESIIDQSVRMIVDTDVSNVEITILPQGKLYTFVFSI